MDKLPEPEFGRDENWSRLLTGVEEQMAVCETKYFKLFPVLAAGSIFRYYREITFYKKNYVTSFGIFAAFLFSSHNIAKFLSEDPFLLAAEENNKREQEFITSYKALYSNARRSNLDIPNGLIF